MKTAMQLVLESREREMREKRRLDLVERGKSQIETWKDFRFERPRSSGLYFWKMNHQFIEELVVEFRSVFILKGNIILPDFTLASLVGPVFWGETTGLEHSPHIIGTILDTCPFCKRTPRWRCGNHFPISAKRWWLECCKWAKQVIVDDPRRLSQIHSEEETLDAR